MKPNFALSLSFEGIRLLHRASDGWRQVGEVAVDAEDMAAQLAALRSTATASAERPAQYAADSERSNQIHDDRHRGA